MPPQEARAWLSALSMAAPYLVYFTVQYAAPHWVETIAQRFWWLAGTATAQAAAYLGGLLFLKARERGEPIVLDERDRTINARATRLAYFWMISAMILVGMVLPFERSGWALVNAALLLLVAIEVMRNGLIIHGYRAPTRPKSPNGARRVG